MSNGLSGTVREVGEGFIVLGTGIRITVSSRFDRKVWPKATV
jgi:hypothetical protein